MPDGVALALALVVLAATLAAAVTRPPYLSEAVVATAVAVVLLIVGVVGLSQVGDALGDLGPTVVFLAALLVIADGCRREGLFDAMGALMARGSRGSPQRLLALVFAVAAAVVVWFLMSRTSFGLRLQVLGASTRSARHMGLDVPRLIVVEPITE